MNIKSIAKFVDQPLVVNKLQKSMPTLLVTSALGYGAYKTYQAPKDKRKDALTKNAVVLGSTVAASIIAAQGLKVGKTQIIKGLFPPADKAVLLAKQKKAVEKFLLDEKNVDSNVKKALERAKGNALSLLDVDVVLDKTSDSKRRKELFETLFAPPDELCSKSIFSEMKRLPVYGASAIGGGLLGGIVADKLTATGSKKSTANKVKEAFYQYFANTFLCIVGSGTALMGAEKLHKAGVIKNFTPAKKMAAVVGGILGVGVVFGSIAANVVGKKVINPMFGQKESAECEKKIYSERRPELLDVCMHADDLATAGIYSGFKWIESVLPLFYLIGGYRAGMGYRNNAACAVQQSTVGNETFVTQGRCESIDLKKAHSGN